MILTNEEMIAMERRKHAAYAIVAHDLERTESQEINEAMQ